MPKRRPEGNSMGKRIAFVVFLALPFVILAILLLAIAASADRASTGGSADPAAYAQPDENESLTEPEKLPQGFIIIAEDPQKLGGPESPIFVGTNHGNWHPGNPAFRMEPRSDGRWQLILDQPTQPGRMQFKFTRGNWETVEIAEDESDIPNRTLPGVDPAQYEGGEKPVFEFTILKWADQKAGAVQQRGIEDTSVALDVTGEARRLQLVGGAGRAAGMVRDAVVWLPPGYGDATNAERTYPVLYLMDGQNVFMQQPGVPGEWHADETASEMILGGAIKPVIIVGVPHSGFSRADEYLPVDVLDGAEASADEFVSWLEHGVMPRVERAFRVETGPEHTAIGGASFGGVIALHAATQRPELFGAAIVESPAVLSKDGLLLNRFLAMPAWPDTVFIGMGSLEAGEGEDGLNGRYVEAAKAMAHAADTAGSDVEMVIGDGHVHHEGAWAERFGAALEHLYGTGQITR